MKPKPMTDAETWKTKRAGVQWLVPLVLLLLLSGCDDGEMYWVERHEPTTDAERQAVSEQVHKIMAATPRTLSGSDQDWDDAIAAATRSAKETCCRATLWEHAGYGRWTGKWRYVDDPK